jgi:hypothetical protein
MSRHMLRGIVTDFRSGGSIGGLLMCGLWHISNGVSMMFFWCVYG